MIMSDCDDIDNDDYENDHGHHVDSNYAQNII